MMHFILFYYIIIGLFQIIIYYRICVYLLYINFEFMTSRVIDLFTYSRCRRSSNLLLD